MTTPAKPFDEATILAEAQASAGLERFGTDEFREPLGILLAALAEAPLHALGIQIMRNSVIWSLVSRLRAQYWFDRHPEIAEEEIAPPLVVVGMMRSGTTLVQRLLASDRRHYSALGWEVGAPAPTPGAWPADPDPRIEAAERQSSQTRRFAPELFSIHPTYPLQAEEEIVFLADAFLSHVPEASCDVPRYRSWLDGQDFTPAYKYLRRMLQLLQWQKKERGERRDRWVLKTPAHLGYLEDLFATFPEARVIHMHRHPVETIASGASLNTTLWRLHSDAVDPRRVGEQWLERMAWANDRALAFRSGPQGRSARFIDVWYANAVSASLDEAGRIYHAAGIDFDNETRRAMATWLEENSQEKLGSHRYSPEDFGLKAEEIEEKFAPYITRFIAPYTKPG